MKIEYSAELHVYSTHVYLKLVQWQLSGLRSYVHFSEDYYTDLPLVISTISLPLTQHLAKQWHPCDIQWPDLNVQLS